MNCNGCMQRCGDGNKEQLRNSGYLWWCAVKTCSHQMSWLFEGKLDPVSNKEAEQEIGTRSEKLLLRKCCQIYRLLSQVTADRRLNSCRPRRSRKHKVSADAWAISPLQLSVTLENRTVLPEMLCTTQLLMCGTS